MKKILILGCGALGSNLAANLVSDLRNEINLTILDFDTIEERNVQAGTQFYTPEQVGLPKVQALQYNLYKWFGKEVETIHGDVTKVGIPNNTDLVIDCLDNYEARQMVQLFHDWKDKSTLIKMSNTFNILHCGFSGKMTFEISWADNYEVPDDSKDPIDICEMQGAGSFIKMVAGIASRTVIEFITTGEKKYFIGNRFSVRPVV